MYYLMVIIILPFPDNETYDIHCPSNQETFLFPENRFPKLIDILISNVHGASYLNVS